MGENGFLDDLLQGKMLGRCSDFFADDFEEAYIQFLTEKKKRADFQSQPLYLIIEDGEKFSIQSKRFLDRILRMEEFRIIIITSEENPSFVPERKELSEITFPALTGEEAAARLRLAFPQVEWDREKREQLEKLSRSNPEQLFFAAWLLTGGECPESGGDMRLQLIDRLDDEERRLFYFILIGQGLIRQDILIRLFSSVDEEFLVTERIRRLLSLQLVRCNSRDELYAAVTDYPVEGELKKSIVKQVIGQLSEEETIHPFRYFEFLEKQSVLDEALHYLKSIMTWLINNGFHNKAQSLIKTPPFSGRDIDRESRDTLQNLLVSNRLRLALQDREGSELAELVSGGLLSLVSERGEFAEDFFIQLSRYFYCRGNTEQTVNYAKNALYLFQKQGNHLGEGLANMELAFAYLGQKKIQMAMDYFEIARRISYQIEDNYTLITAQTFSALTAFLFGNISKSEDIITQTLELAELNGCRRRTFFLNFLAGRIQFEYGHYKEGAELFEKCWRESENIDMNGGRETARRWIGRCLLYQEKRRDAFRWLDSEDQSREGLFILAEADFMVSLYESALKRLEQALDTPHDRTLSYTERDIWCDGFMPIEGRLSSEEQEEDVLTRQIETLYSYILVLSGRHEEGARFFPKGLNQDDYPFKPYSYQYSYIYFTILNVGEITANSDDHRLAALSKAIERLHSRGGRFDNQHKKLDFLNKNWWNKKIMDEAHKKKFF